MWRQKENIKLNHNASEHHNDTRTPDDEDGERVPKEKTEELLKEKDEILKLKEEELETKGREQDKLQMELKKLQKLKEFKPTMAFPIVQSLNDEKKKWCSSRVIRVRLESESGIEPEKKLLERSRVWR
ncbi:unnamed protein product [Prunus brigantina]